MWRQFSTLALMICGLALLGSSAQASCRTQLEDRIRDEGYSRSWWYQSRGDTNFAVFGALALYTTSGMVGHPELQPLAVASTLAPAGITSTRVHELKKKYQPIVDLTEQAELGDGVALREFAADVRPSALSNVDLLDVANVLVDLSRNETICPRYKAWATLEEIKALVRARLEENGR